MISTKLSVTIELPGSTMITSQECEENLQEKEDKHSILLSVKHWDKKTKKFLYRREPLNFSTRKRIPAYQHINMCEEAYRYMISTACPEWYGGIDRWKKLSAESRLHLHLKKLCEDLNGLSYTYVIFKD